MASKPNPYEPALLKKEEKRLPAAGRKMDTPYGPGVKTCKCKVKKAN